MAQKVIRGYLARKKHRPRFKGMTKIKSALESVEKIKAIARDLKLTSCDEILKQTTVLEQLILNSIKKIKAEPNIQSKVIDKLYVDILSKIDSLNNFLQSELHKQRKQQEEKRLRIIQEQIEAERRQKEDEEDKIRQEEEIRKQLVFCGFLQILN